MSYENNKIVQITFIILLLAILGVIFQLINKVILKDVKIEKQENNNKSFAIMVDDGTGNYEEQTTFPKGNYELNTSKSGCMDFDGNLLGNKIEYDNVTGQIIVNLVESIRCYFYFDAKKFKGTGEELVNEAVNWGIEGLSTEEQGGMYRYQGECSSAKDCEGKVDNYICFGTSNQEECTSNPSKYMYRIIGIDAKTKELKLIKKDVLAESARWYYFADGAIYYEISDNITWIHSDIARQINGFNTVDMLSTNHDRTLTPLFVNNSAYGYMKEGNEWYEKISPHEWYYGDLELLSVNAEEIYKIETGQTDSYYYGHPPIASLEHGYWQKISQEEANDFKIGLMYLHDYYYSSQIGGKNCYESGGCGLSWLFADNNNSGPVEPAECFMTRAGVYNGSGDDYSYLYVNTDGNINVSSLNNFLPLRPVFYLNYSVVISGEGTYTNPFMIK